MTPKEKQVVKNHLHQVYSSWHGCSLKEWEWKLETPKRRKELKVGQLCDDCNQMIDAHMKDIVEESK